MEMSGAGADWAEAAKGAASAKGAGAAGGGGPSPLTIAGMIVEGIGYTGQFGERLLGAWGTYLAGKMSARSQKLQATGLRYDAAERLEDATAYLTSAGKAQKAGEDEAVNRYLRLGQDIGRIYAGAAAGNIDVASRSVGRVDSAARLMAGRDVKAIGANAADRANAYVAEATSARVDYIRQMARAKMLDINASYERKMSKGMMRSQMLSAAGRFVSDLAGMAQ